MPTTATTPPPTLPPAPRMLQTAHIPAGLAPIGCASGCADEGPPHWVDVPPFAIGIHPITNLDWAAFLAERCLPPPLYWYDPHLNHPTQPVVGVAWRDTVAYCRWLTWQLWVAGTRARGHVVRLPTEVEWEKAASWDPVLRLSRRYPWGDIWDGARAVTAATDTSFPCRWAGTRGVSAYGVHDMLGNVWEWTASVYQSYVGAAAPFAEPDRYVIRGGSCTMWPSHLRCASRSRLPPDAWRSHLGFRIVVAAPLG